MNVADTDNPFVAVYESGKCKFVNVESSTIEDQFFGKDMALIFPLAAEGQRIGVIGLWLPKKRRIRPQDLELGVTIAGHLSNLIRADLNIRKLRSDLGDVSDHLIE